MPSAVGGWRGSPSITRRRHRIVSARSVTTTPRSCSPNSPRKPRYGPHDEQVNAAVHCPTNGTRRLGLGRDETTGPREGPSTSRRGGGHAAHRRDPRGRGASIMSDKNTPFG